MNTKPENDNMKNVLKELAAARPERGYQRFNERDRTI